MSKIFFYCEFSVRLIASKADGGQVLIHDNEVIYFKLKFDKMNLKNTEELVRRFPDGWVRGKVTYLNHTGKKITIELCDWPKHLITIRRGDIVDITYDNK